MSTKGEMSRKTKAHGTGVHPSEVDDLRDRSATTFVRRTTNHSDHNYYTPRVRLDLTVKDTQLTTTTGAVWRHLRNQTYNRGG